MVSTYSSIESETAENGSMTASRPALMICVPSMQADALHRLLVIIAATFPNESVLVASPDHVDDRKSDGLQQKSLSISETIPHLVAYTAPRSHVGWVLAAGDYVAAAETARAHNAEFIILLNDGEISIDLLRSFDHELRENRTDLVLPLYSVGPADALVTSALLYPLTRVLFGVDVRFPLPLNAGLSLRAADRLGVAARKLTANGMLESLFWPVPEAAIAGFSIRQIDAGPRSMPQPAESDFNVILTNVAGSLFTDIESRASFWQRARATPASRGANSCMATSSEYPSDLQPMIDNFRLAYTNLQEIWSLVIPPQSLVALKRLSTTPAETFAIPPQLWARIAYDFILAFHLRTLNRGHLLGAFTPLYLAWVVSALHHLGCNPASANDLLKQTVEAYEAEKPYLLSRWRWPDRFNP
jgi:hypothetical protein